MQVCVQVTQEAGLDLDLGQVFIGHLLKNKFKFALWPRSERVSQVEEGVRGETERRGLARLAQGAPERLDAAGLSSTKAVSGLAVQVGYGISVF